MSEDHHESRVPRTKTSNGDSPHRGINVEENCLNILSLDINQANIHANLREAKTYNDTLPNCIKSKPKHLNGLQAHVISKGCKDLLKIHRCLSDGRLTEFNNGTEETHISRSLSSSDCYMNGSNCSETGEKANEMAGADSKSIGTVQKSKQTDDTSGKSRPVNGERHAETNAVGLNNGDNPSGAFGNDIVRPKTWSRKLAEKCRLRKDIAKESVRKNTQNRCNGNLDDGNAKPRTKTCRAYEHDRDLIKQQRAGLVNGNGDIECSVLEIPLPLPNNNDWLTGSNDNVFAVPGYVNVNGVIEARTDLVSSDVSDNKSQRDLCSNSIHSANADTPTLVVAPLAEPEDTSDDEIGAFYRRNAAVKSLSENSDTKSAIDQSECDLSETNTEFMPESLSVCDIEHESQNQSINIARTEINAVRTDPSIGFAEYPESIFSRAPDEDDASLSFGYSSPQSNTVSGASPSQTQTLIDRQSSGRNDAMNAAAQNLQQASSSSLESLEEIGDYIETDLPPNRLAFFSRGSSSSTTTEEDEGCGDEVLPNNDEESDNETIDPLSSYHNPGLPNLPDVHYNNKPLSFSMNFSSDRGQNVCFRNPNWGQNLMGNSLVSSSLANDVKNCDSQNDSVNESDSENHITENFDLAEVNSARCLSVNSQQNDLVLENKEEKSKETNQTLHVHDANDRNPFESAINPCESNDSKKRQNSLVGVPRLSSSDSDPAGMMFMMSDDSENVSPEYESGTEYVFPSIDLSASFSGAMGGAHSRQQPSIVFGDPSAHPRNQTASLDFDRDDEILHYPFFVRRARSLDQEIDTRCRIQNRLSDIDAPNIPPVASSNLQHHESNQNQKVFEKSAFELMVPLPVWDSSDEDENNRVPDIEPLEEEPLDQIFESMENQLIQRQAEAGNHCLASNISMPADEPIYEEIDDLLVLMDEICSEGEPDNLQPVCNAISKLRRKRRHRSPVSDVEKVMIWNEYEAYVVQVKQIGTSACGPTAVLNVLKAFDFQVEKEEVCQTITSNMRMEAAPIPYYLFSRSTAGTTAQALVEGVAGVTRGAIKGRFFHFYPRRDVELTKWLGHWMKKGAVPVATLNLQRGVKPGWTIPDAWHHQMVYGVSSKGVYLTNPLEIVPETVIMDQLTSDSVLLVRRHDVISRFRDWCPLNEILKQRDNRWRTMNVIGQVVHMLRESMVPQEQIPGARAQLTSHITIPAVYKAGIILFMRANTDTYEELLKAPELPLKQEDNTQPS